MAVREHTPKTTSQKTAQIHYTVPYENIPPLPDDMDTIPKAFVTTAGKQRDRVAMRKKRFGIWQEYTWTESLAHVRHFALGLVSMGLERGQRVAIIGENDPEFYWAEIAAHCAGATSVAIFTDAGPDELFYIVDNSQAVFLLAHDQEQVDKALYLQEKLPNVRKVIYWEERGLWNYDDDILMRFDEVEELGRAYDQKNPDAFDKMVAAGDPDDIAIFSYTSGTSGLPKGAMVRHRNLLFATRHTTEITPVYPTDEYVSFSPLAWITEQGLGLAAHSQWGMTVNFPEGPETIQTDIREIAPNALLFPSRLWENLARQMQVRINDSTWLNRALYAAFMPVAYRIIDLEDEGKTIPPHLRLLRWMGEYAVMGPLRDKIGMSRIRDAFTSGAVLSPDILRFFRAIGVELWNIYGSSEMQGVTTHFKGNVKLESVGKPIPGVQIKIAENGEIRVNSRAVFAGYHEMPDKTAEAFDEDGFFCTGDAGYVDDEGHLIYLDRVKDMIELANGERFSPQYIEGRLKFSPYIQDVMAVGGFDMEYVTAIVIIDYDNMSRWAEKNRINFTTYVDLTQKPQVYELVQNEVERVNGTLPPAGRIKKFVILHKAFDADEAELTRTRKLRRRALEERYSEMLDAMYGNKDEVRVKAEVKYRDGRMGTVETAVRVATL